MLSIFNSMITFIIILLTEMYFTVMMLPPLNYSLQSAVFNQRGMAGMAHGVTPTRLVLPIGYSTDPLAKGKGDEGSF